jgi:hypothetical protein
MLELDYSIVRGFDGGIGYTFNEEDRFAYFVITTSDSAMAFLGLLTLELRPLEPISSASSTGALDLLELEIEPLAPSITVSFVNASVSSLVWDYDDSFAEVGIVAAQSVTVSVLPGDASVFSYPTWMTVVDADDPIMTGGTVSMYPTVNNDTYSNLVGTVVFKNVVGTAFNLTVTQNGRTGVPPTPVSCDLFVQLGDANGLSIDFFTKIVTGYVGLTEVNLTFIPNYPGKATGESYTLYWYAKIDGVYDGSTGSFTAQNLQYNFPDVNLIAPVPVSATSVIIYLSSESF